MNETYQVTVYFWDDTYSGWHPHGTWEGEAASETDAEKRALDALVDERIDGWKAEVTGVVDEGEDEGE